MIVITIFHNFQAKTTYYCLLGHQICRTLVWWLMSQEIQLPYAADYAPVVTLPHDIVNNTGKIPESIFDIIHH